MTKKRCAHFRMCFSCMLFVLWILHSVLQLLILPNLWLLYSHI
ncbi:hypothetical protein CsSME_00004156 [Camellia sinensis var. sinensis]